MKSFLRLSLAEQTAAHLRARHWGGKLPGVVRLGTELHVSQATMRAAIRQFEAEGPVEKLFLVDGVAPRSMPTTRASAILKNGPAAWA